MTTFAIRNATGLELSDVVVILPGKVSTDLGALAAGEASARRTTDTLHRYLAVRASGPSGELVHLPFDGDHQPELPAGDYTYVLRVETGRLVVDLEPSGLLHG